MNNLSQAADRSSHYYFLLAFGLLNILAITLILCGVSFLAGFTVSSWQFPLGCLLTLAINFFASRYFISKQSHRYFLKSSGIIIFAIIALIFVAGSIDDVSYDGQWYHQETVYRLKNGYNPTRQMLGIPADELNNTDCPIWCSGPDPIAGCLKSAKLAVNLKILAINYFSKGSEIIEAAIYAVTGRIETGKAVNGILLLAAFFLSLSLLYKANKISVPKKWLLALIIAFNPVAVMQWLSFCVDGNVACLILCLVLACILLYLEANIYYLALFSVIIVLVINLKFTSLIFAGIYGFAFLVALYLAKKRNIIKPVLIAGIVGALTGIVCCGFNPYITNLVQKKDVFYGTEAVRNETQQIMPQLFKDHNNIETFLLSLSSHQGWHLADKGSLSKIPKIPFTINKDDILSARDGQQELSGFGPFFSGILLISLLVFAVILASYRKAPIFTYLLALMLVTIFTVLITPYSWWARYVPQFWLVPAIILCLAELLLPAGRRWLVVILYLSTLINVAWALLNPIFNISSTARINYQMSQIKSLHQPVKIKFCMHEAISSNRIRFEEWGIPTMEGDVTGPYVYNVEGSTTRFQTPVALPELPKPFLLRWSEHLKGTK